ncbi:hypothetical protein LZ31DRAFT_349211 [Colletotrichum somersetense]|nr:hypothetical protein LZ31DRAFT_349211 [Colletotrichum somersetense]
MLGSRSVRRDRCLVPRQLVKLPDGTAPGWGRDTGPRQSAPRMSTNTGMVEEDSTPPFTFWWRCVAPCDASCHSVHRTLQLPGMSAFGLLQSQTHTHAHPRLHATYLHTHTHTHTRSVIRASSRFARTWQDKGVGKIATPTPLKPSDARQVSAKPQR